MKNRQPPRASAPLSSAQVIPRLPDWRDPAGAGEHVPTDLVGATILCFGAAPPECGIEGGGLVIDYRSAEGVVRRLVLAFNELGMWIIQDCPALKYPTAVPW